MEKTPDYTAFIAELEKELSVSSGSFNISVFTDNTSEANIDMYNLDIHSEYFDKVGWCYSKSGELTALRFVIPCFRKGEFVKALKNVLTNLDWTDNIPDLVQTDKKPDSDQSEKKPDLKSLECADFSKGTVPLGDNLIFSYPDDNHPLFQIKTENERLIVDIYPAD